MNYIKFTYKPDDSEEEIEWRINPAYFVEAHTFPDGSTIVKTTTDEHEIKEKPQEVVRQLTLAQI